MSYSTDSSAATVVETTRESVEGWTSVKPSGEPSIAAGIACLHGATGESTA